MRFMHGFHWPAFLFSEASGCLGLAGSVKATISLGARLVAISKPSRKVPVDQSLLGAVACIASALIENCITKRTWFRSLQDCGFRVGIWVPGISAFFRLIPPFFRAIPPFPSGLLQGCIL